MRYTLGTLALWLTLAPLGFGQFGPTRPLGGAVGGGPGFAPSGGFGGGFGTVSGSGVSPYLNLVGSRNSALNAATSYGIFRQQTDLRASLQSLQQQVYVGGASGSTGAEEFLQGITIGTRVRFLNTGNYFQSLGGTTLLPTGGLVAPLGQGTGLGSGLGAGLGTGGSMANPGFGTGGLRPVGGGGGGVGIPRPNNPRN
ncbi:MAG: hypothetical protein N2112_04235 [Gemmataceae bacterium]|jgi:hypothetical protein|nr:hypothetical protein [Gemmataceae bacterium]